MVAIQSFITLALTAFGAAQAASVQKRAISGRGTFYSVGMGNCGWQSSSNQYVVALNTAQYGSTSQVSGACGQTVTINYNGKSAQAQIVDSCPTCPYGALDMSTGLFSYLTNGNMGLGEIQMSWSWGSGSSNSNSNSNSNNNSNNNDSSDDSSSSSSSSSATPTSTSTSATAASSTAAATATPTNMAQKTVSGMPVWWASIGSSGCDVTVPEGADEAAIAPSGNAEVADLPAACGKWVSIINPANNKTTKAVVTSWLPGADRNSITLADAYTKLADMNGNVPEQISQVTWGFLN